MTTLLTGGGMRSREALDDDVDLVRDRALVTRAQAGDRAAFDDLYVRYYRRLYRFCLRRLHDSHEAEDVAQESFARAWRALPNFAGDRRFYPWLSVIAAHLCTDVLRRRNRSTPVAEFHQGNVASTEDGGEELMIAAVDSDLVSRAFQRLSDRHQRILNLREGSGWSYQRIADHEGVGITAVETLLWRARQALKREFAALAGSEGRTAGWIAGIFSLATLRRLLRLPMHAAKRAANFAHTAPAVAVGSAAAATAMVVAASLSAPASQPARAPASTGITSIASTQHGAPTTPTSNQSGSGTNSGSVPTSGGGSTSNASGASLPQVPTANPTQTVGGAEGTISGAEGSIAGGAPVSIPTNPISNLPTTGLPTAVENSGNGVGGVLNQVGDLGDGSSVLGPAGTSLNPITSAASNAASNATSGATQAAGNAGSAAGAAGNTAGTAVGGLTTTATSLANSASSSDCGSVTGVLHAVTGSGC